MKLIECNNKLDVLENFIIRKKVFIEEQNVSYSDEYDLLEIDAIMFLLIDDLGNKVSCARLFIEEENNVRFGHVGRVATLKEYRGKGYASFMLSKIQNYLLDRGIHEMRLHAQTVSLGFYLKNGFEVISEVYYEANMPHVLIKKEF